MAVGHERVMWNAAFIEAGGEECQGSLSPRPSSELCSESSPLRSVLFDADRMVDDALSKHMEGVWAANSRKTRRNRVERRGMSAAVDAIHLLPEQLSSAVQTKAKGLAGSVKIDLFLVQRVIRRSGVGDDVVDEAIDQLDKIPEIIRSSFVSKIEEANEAMQVKLSAIMQTFKGRAPESQEVMTQLCNLPEKFEQITCEAVDQAMHDFQREAASCYDRVSRSLPEDAGFSHQALKDAESQIAKLSMPEMYFATMRALRSTTNAHVKHAVAYVDDPKEVPSTKTNALAADVLPRAKLGTLPQTTGASVYQSSRCAASMQDYATGGGGDGALASHRGRWQARLASSAECSHPSNPGSLGHPEMCFRTCLYFMEGRCANGDACRFCHCPHSTRPVHLGKSQRKFLETSTAADCFGILLPILERKMVMLRLATDALQLLAGQQCAGPGEVPVDAGSQFKARELRSLEKALRAVPMRSLLMVLRRKMGAQSSRETAVFDALILELREAGFQVDFEPGFPGDA
ncbi:unnamed protein product [Prorocentrum cordatum]|uniref:C3H1-type domain-containing protein n=1 Tax=Prorocentrum cordatum TaxID=2364126 RepID=A0ABN9QIF8_9DINO|nr:unnamed protein product [Polarella glacialis]